MKNFTCKDGALIEWIDKETIRYTKNSFSVDVWTDFGAGFFTRSRVLKSESIVYWRNTPNASITKINDSEKLEIIDAISEYYNNFKVKFRIE